MDHFYLYDNESEDNLKEILQPYIEAGLVSYHFYVGKNQHIASYNDSVRNYKFECRYMAFIDADEFILPHNDKKIMEIVDELLNDNSYSAALVVNWHCFGSARNEKADLSKGVLERFCYRSNNDFEDNKHVKTIANPRCINVVLSTHFSSYFEGKIPINEKGVFVSNAFTEKCSTDKIVINHYFTKSKEEFLLKKKRGTGDGAPLREMSDFYKLDRNDVYDDEILKYRAMRQELQKSRGGIESAQQINQRRFNAIIGTLSPLILSANLSLFDDKNGIFSGKIHLFLTCWAVSRDLKTAGLNEQDTTFFEELSLKCLYKSLLAGSVEIWQLQLLIDELPKILSCKYSIVNDIKETVISIIPQFMNYRRMQNNWTSYKQLDYLLQML